MPSLDSCSSQNKILPSTRFGSVIGFSTGTGTGGRAAASSGLAAKASNSNNGGPLRIGAFYRLVARAAAQGIDTSSKLA